MWCQAKPKPTTETLRHRENTEKTSCTAEARRRGENLLNHRGQEGKRRRTRPGRDVIIEPSTQVLGRKVQENESRQGRQKSRTTIPGIGTEEQMMGARIYDYAALSAPLEQPRLCRD